MKTRLACLTCFALLWAAQLGWSAQFTVQDATLYVAAPADVKATLTPDAPEATLELPGGLVPGSLQATQGDAIISVVAQPIRGEDLLAADLHGDKISSYRVQLTGLQAGQLVELSFRTNGLRWTPSSSLRLTGAEGRFQTQASITNDALDLTGARLRLMSGYVGGAAFDYEAYGQAMAELGRSFSPAGEGELHLVAELPSTDVPKGGIRQVPLLSAKVSVTRSYQWSTGSESEYEGSFRSRPERAQALYSFPNSASQGLPESRVTVFEGDSAVGSGYLAWTPEGETALIAVPTVRGLQVSRREDSKPHPETWTNTRTVKLALDNSRSEALTVKVTEKLPYRWEDDSSGGSKRVYEFSQQPSEASKKGAFVWEVEAPAHKTAEITYSYQEPVDLSPSASPPLRPMTRPSNTSTWWMRRTPPCDRTRLAIRSASFSRAVLWSIASRSRPMWSAPSWRPGWGTRTTSARRLR